MYERRSGLFFLCSVDEALSATNAKIEAEKKKTAAGQTVRAGQKHG